MRVLVTGASGRVGTAVCMALRAQGCDLRRALRVAAGDDTIGIGDIGGDTDWRAALEGMDAVIHCAAVTAAEGIQSGPAADRAFSVNRDGSRALAEAAAGRIGRFIHISTIKVLGETADRPLDETAGFAPFDAYAAGKAQAESAVTAALSSSGTALTILRPPLVFGRRTAPDGGGNFHRLARLARSGLPLPFASVTNRRSLIFSDNLAHYAVAALTVTPGLYHLADPPALSTAEWIRLAASVQGARARLLSVPPGLVRAGLIASGRGGAAERLLGSLELSTARADAVFPKALYSLEAGFALALA